MMTCTTLYTQLLLAVTTKTYDENGLLIEDGNYTWTYDYYDDGTMKSRTKLDSSGKAVYKHIYEYDIENKAITRHEYGDANSVKNNSQTRKDVFYYDDQNNFLEAQAHAEQIDHGFFTGIERPFGMTERNRTFYDGNTWGQGTGFNEYDSQGRLTGWYVCGYNTTCIEKARNGDYSLASIKRKYEYSTDENGILTVIQKRGSGNSWYVEDTYRFEYDEYGNLIKSYQRGTLAQSITWKDPNWKANTAAKKAAANHQVKRIYTVEEATEAAKGNKNTFSIRYR